MNKTKNDLPVKARHQITAHQPSAVSMRSNHKSISNHRLAEPLASSEA
jgi:hypothetical protein